MTNKYGTGYKPEPAGHRRTPFHHLVMKLGVSSTTPDEVDLDPEDDSNHIGILDQGQTGACTMHAGALAIALALILAGTPLGFIPSPAEGYRNGRAIDREFDGNGHPTTPLTDEGADPDQVYRAISEFGVRPMHAPTSDGRYSDADPATINDEPKLGDVEEEATTLLIGQYGITSSGKTRILQLRQSLFIKKPITIALAADGSLFQNYTGGVLGPLGTELDHYVVIVAYKTLPSGETIFKIRNSWSKDWGVNGYCWVSEACIQQFGSLVVADVRKVAA